MKSAHDLFLISADIPQMGSVGTRKAAPLSTFGQSERVCGGGCQVQGKRRPAVTVFRP